MPFFVISSCCWAIARRLFRSAVPERICLTFSSETSPSLSSSSCASRFSFELLYCVSICATCDCWSSSARSSSVLRLVKFASADACASCASITDWRSSGLLSSRITVSGFTSAPGRRRIRSTRPCVVVLIHRMSSGTSVPEPRTSRSIGPRLTVSTQTAARSTDGAAGFSRDTPMVIRMMTTSADVAMAARLIFFFFATAGERAMSTI